MPTLSQCQNYADGYAAPRSKFYIDHNGAQAHAALFSNMYAYPTSQGSIYFPWNAVLGGASREYVYADGAGVASDVINFLNAYLP